MSDHETTLRELAAGLLARGRIDAEEPSSASQRADIIRKSERNADACLAGADALRRGTWQPIASAPKQDGHLLLL